MAAELAADSVGDCGKNPCSRSTREVDESPFSLRPSEDGLLSLQDWLLPPRDILRMDGDERHDLKRLELLGDVPDKVEEPPLGPCATGEEMPLLSDESPPFVVPSFVWSFDFDPLLLIFDDLNDPLNSIFKLITDSDRGSAAVCLS